MKRSQVLSVVAASLAALLVFSTGASALTSGYRARHALRYIARHQNHDGSIVAFSPLGSTADTVLALVAAQRGPVRLNRALGYLRRHVAEATSIGLKAKVVLAAVAAARDPRAFGGRNLVWRIRHSQRRNGHYGKGGSVIDQALAMLAIVAADRQPTPPAARWLKRAQCPDGGWQFDAPYHPSRDSRHCHQRGVSDFTRSDTNTTSYAVQALDAMAAPPAPSASPFAYFRARRDPIRHGWGYDSKSSLTDANSTALVLQAYAAAGRQLPYHARRALKKLQYGACSKHLPFAFAFTWERGRAGRLKRTGPDVGATIGAVLGLLQQPLPVPAAPVPQAIPRRVAC